MVGELGNILTEHQRPSWRTGPVRSARSARGIGGAKCPIGRGSAAWADKGWTDSPGENPLKLMLRQIKCIESNLHFAVWGWSKYSRLRGTRLVHTASSGERQVTDFVDFLKLARQSLFSAANAFVAEPVIGPAEGGTRWLLAMTAPNKNGGREASVFICYSLA